jgi:hypothetical protein
MINPEWENSKTPYVCPPPKKRLKIKVRPEELQNTIVAYLASAGRE